MDDLNDTINHLKVIKIDMSKGMSRNSLLHKYAEFQKRKPKTFFHILDGSVCENQLEELKNKYLNTLNKNNDTLEATTVVGKMLADKFLYPSIADKFNESNK